MKKFIYITIFILAKLTYSQTALPCNNNLYCDPASQTLPADIYINNARSVIKMTITGSGGGDCTCTLLRQLSSNNDDNQQQNIIITARHCIHQGSSQQSPLVNLNNLIFYFNYSNPGCATTPNVPNKQFRYEITGGATLIDESFINDIAILRINNPIPPHYKPFYSGWTAAPFTSFSAKFFDIHHADGDIKKISSAPLSFVDPIVPIPTRYNVKWLDGITQGGSSGSSLFNYNRRVIGAASFALSSNNTCSSGLFINFGKFRNFWLGSNATRNVLKPNNNNPLIIGNPGGEIDCYTGDLNLSGNYWPAGDYQPNNVITLKAQNNIYLAQNNTSLIVYSGAEFHFEAGGQVIVALPGFNAQAGSTVSIKSNMACSPMRPSGILKEDIDSSIVNYFYDEANGELPKEEISSIENFSALEIHPNPSKGQFIIQSKNYTTDIYSFELIDVNGKILFSQSSLYFDGGIEKKLNFPELTSGVYVLKIYNEYSKKQELKKLIIQK